MSDEYLEPLMQAARPTVKNGLRAIAISGHQEYWRGWFHGFGTTLIPSVYIEQAGLIAPRTIAIVEDEQGSIHEIELFKLKFLSPLGEVPR